MAEGLVMLFTCGLLAVGASLVLYLGAKVLMTLVVLPFQFLAVVLKLVFGLVAGILVVAVLLPLAAVLIPLAVVLVPLCFVGFLCGVAC